jgi:S-DNA-T family DNA segregation ATPase FtsK/SpoIIIE
VDRYCVVLCGLQAGVSEESAAWSPVVAALKLNQAEFAQRVIASLPLIVRQDLDQASAERIVELLRAMQADARALPDDGQLVYIRHAQAVCGPLPQSALGDFIEAGDAYQVRGSSAWLAWPAPADEESMATDADDLQDASASTAFADEPIEYPAEASHETLSPHPSSDDEHDATIGTATDAPAHTSFATAVKEPSHIWPPPLPESSSAQDQAPETIAEMPADPDESTVAGEAADELINPLDETAISTDPGADVSPMEVTADATPPTRSRGTRLILLLVLAGMAYWAYNHWTADTRHSQAPSAAPTRQTSTPGATDNLARPGQTEPATDAKPAAATSAAKATSAPIPAASTTPATAASVSAAAASGPATAASVSAAAASAPAQTTSTSTPSASSSTAQAKPALPALAVISRAAATSAAAPGASH